MSNKCKLLYHFISSHISQSKLTLAQWDHGSIRGLGWSDDERLLAITEDGTVRCYYGLSGDFTPFSLGSVSK